MMEKNSFLSEIKLKIEKKACERWLNLDNFVISKKTIRGLIDEIFDYLSLKEVYVNVFDNDFEKLIMNDLSDLILNLTSFFKDYVFLNDFKSSIRHVHNKERDRLMDFLEIFDFEKLRPILELTLKNKGKTGRPPYDVVLMFKILIIKVYYNLSDEKTARRIKSDDTCQCFLNYPDQYPCKSTIWNFREEIANLDLYDQIWDLFKFSTMEGEYSSGNQVRQDSSFFTSDKGQKKKDYPRGDEAKTTRSRDGTFAKKNNKTFFGWKYHSKQDVKNQLINEFDLTPAHIHDMKINLCEIDEIDFKDRGYFEKKYKQFNGAMTRAVRNHPLVIWEKLRNKRIARKRAPVERPYSFIKRINNSHTQLTTTKRNYVVVTILSMLFNIEQLITLKKQEKTENAEEEKENELIDYEIPFNFFNNSIYYYENSSMINFLVNTSNNKHIKASNKDKKLKKNNTISISKSDYRRNIKRKLKTIRKQKRKKIEKNHKKLIKSLNEFHLILH